MIASLPSFLSPITPRLSCRVSGADFLKASNSMRLKSWLWNGSSLLLAYRHVGSPAAHRLIQLSHRIRLTLPAYRRLIPSRCRLANGAAVPITPCFTPRQSCRLTVRRMCLDVIGCRAVDTVDKRYRRSIALSGLPANHPIISSSHPISSIALPPLPGSLMPACLNCSPAPGRGRSRRTGDLRLLVLRRFACFPSCRAALSFPLVRYYHRPRHRFLRCHLCRSVRPVRCFLIASASSSRHHACGSCPPRLPPRPLLSRNGEGLRTDCGIFGCRRLAALLACPMPFPCLVRFCSRPSRPVISCGLAFPHVPTDGCVRCREVASPASPFERFNCF